MQLTSNTFRPFPSDAIVTIDWGALHSNVADNYDDHDIDTLIDWVKSQPRRGKIHVVLRRHPLTAVRTRLLQKSLQSLGCTVIAKMQMTDAPTPLLSSSFTPSEWR